MADRFQWVASILLAGCLVALSACGGDGSGSGSTDGSGTGASPGGGTASLALTVSGLPSGTDANVSVTGPADFRRTVSRATTFANLAAGTYTITAGNVLNGNAVFKPAQPTQLVTVSADKASSVNVTYTAPETLRLSLATVANGLDAPIYLTAPANDTRLFVVERAGRIRVIRNGVLLGTPFLDISSMTSTDGERGLLSMAFDPGYGSNGRFFVYYTASDGAITVARYQV